MLSLILLLASFSFSNRDINTFVTNFTVDPTLDKPWNQYVRENNKVYNRPFENLVRRLIFQENVRRIEAHNQRYEAGKETYRKIMNYFGDLTDKEFLETYLGYGGYFTVKRNEDEASKWTSSPPDSIDWRKKGCVSRVKNQGICGSCWAHSVVAVIESHFMCKTGSRETFSEQQLVDCNGKNSGCYGGLPEGAYEYIVEKGVTKDSLYPYINNIQACNKTLESQPAIKIKDFVSIPIGNEIAMKRAVATVGPVSAALYVTWNMRFYRDGFFSDTTCPKKRMNHVVLIVGYGSDAPNQDYWIMKNSWGPKWGMDGFIKIARNRQNQCGIASSSTYPLL